MWRAHAGYISSIGTREEFGNGSKDSGWLYMVNGTTADNVQPVLFATRDAKVIWFSNNRQYHDESRLGVLGGSSSAGAADHQRRSGPGVADKTGEPRPRRDEKRFGAALDAARMAAQGCVVIARRLGTGRTRSRGLARTAVERLAGETGSA
jgi:hypothetical protein